MGSEMCIRDRSGTAHGSPEHIRQLWDEKVPKTDALRYKGKKLDYPSTTKEWINRQAPIAQAKLWNETKINTAVKPDLFKLNSKIHYLQKYAPDATQNNEER